MGQERYINLIKNALEKRGISSDLIDVSALYDSTLTYSENWINIMSQANESYGQTMEEMATNFKAKEEVYKEQEKESFNENVTDEDFKGEWVDNNQAIAVIGMPNSGKTNLAFYLAQKSSHKNKYLLGYPKKKRGYISIGSIEELPKIREGVLIIDEFSKYFPVWDKRSNQALLELLQFAEHNHIKLILTTQLSQFITKQCEAMIPCWAIKQVNVRRLKNGSTPRYALRYGVKNPNISNDFIKIAINQFAWYNESGCVGENNVYTFPDMNVGKDWGLGK